MSFTKHVQVLEHIYDEKKDVFILDTDQGEFILSHSEENDTVLGSINPNHVVQISGFKGSIKLDENANPQIVFKTIEVSSENKPEEAHADGTKDAEKV
jgi:hypothetical protein